MVDDPNHRDDETAIAVALFRYSVIASLLNVGDDGRSLTRRVKELARELHHHPLDKGDRKVSERSIWEWLGVYKAGGAEALRPRCRKDSGAARALSPQALARAVELRTELPKRDGKTVLDILKFEKLIDGDALPHRSTLDRHLERAGVSRRQLRTLGAPPTIKMRVSGFGSLWVGDYHHGPKCRAPDGRVVTAKLGAFIDHASRYPVCSRFYLSERIGTLRDTMLRALLLFGPPEQAYTDRGSVYRSEQFAYSMACIGTTLMPYPRLICGY